MYKLQSNVPIPSRVVKTRRKTKYPFEQMQIGMSFLVPKKDADNNMPRLMARVGAATALAKKKFGFKFTLRRLPDGVRVWRVQ